MKKKIYELRLPNINNSKKKKGDQYTIITVFSATTTITDMIQTHF